jgi:broad specificity phosphatase PhoE
MAGLIDSLLVDTLFVENPGRELVIVSHQAPIGTLVRYLTGQRLWHLPSTRRCALASVTTVAIELPVERPVELPVELAVAPTTARGRHPAQPRGVVLDYWVPADTIERSAG